MIPRYKEGEKIRFTRGQEHVEGSAILASYSSVRCLTPCPHGKTPNVGSVACTICKYYGGQESFGVATGHTSAGGTIDMERNVYCTRKTKRTEDQDDTTV